MEYNPFDKLKLKWFADSGHGWLRVDKKEFEKDINASRQVSEYSYYDDDYVYLEEDCDASMYINHIQINLLEDMDSYIPEQYYDGDCFVRDLNRIRR